MPPLASNLKTLKKQYAALYLSKDCIAALYIFACRRKYFDYNGKIKQAPPNNIYHYYGIYGEMGQQFLDGTCEHESTKY